MTVEEFSNEFDTLLDSYRRFKDFDNKEELDSLDLSEYEKSVLLTQAQEEIVKELYSGRLSGVSFEKTEELRRNLDSLNKTARPTIIEDTSSLIGISPKSVFYQLPEDVWFITYEQASLGDNSLCKNNPIVRVIPMRQDEWHRAYDNPFRKPNKRKIIRLDNTSRVLELISDYPISDYIVKYLSKPTPIILIKLTGDLTIDNIQDITECKLNTALHRTILERAVQLAYRRLPQASK